MPAIEGLLEQLINDIAHATHHGLAWQDEGVVIADLAAITEPWDLARDALGIEIDQRTVTHRNGSRYCLNCHGYQHAPGCAVGMCEKARDRLRGNG